MTYGEIVIHTSGKYYGLVDLTKSSVFEFSFNGIEFYFSVQSPARSSHVQQPCIAQGRIMYSAFPDHSKGHKYVHITPRPHWRPCNKVMWIPAGLDRNSGHTEAVGSEL